MDVVFAVVANNIRRISEENKDKIGEITRSSTQIVDTLNQKFNQITDMIENIVVVSKENSASPEEVTTTMEDYPSNTQEIAEISEKLLSDTQKTESILISLS